LPPVKSDAEKGYTNNLTQKAEGSNEAASINTMSNGVSITPNPFKGSFIVSINSAKDCKAQVVVYNSLGVKLKEQINLNLLKGSNNITFDCSKFASGVYMLEVNFGDSKIVKKIIKSN